MNRIELENSLATEDIPMVDLAEIVWAANRSVFQVETLDSYGVAHEDAVYRAYLAQRELSDEDLAGYRFWFGKVKGAVERGVDVARAHLTPDTLTDYLKYEIEYGYKRWCIPNGEKVFLISKNQFPLLAAAAFRDFYLLDEEQVLLPVYADQNKYVGLQRVTSRESIPFFVRLVEEIRSCGVKIAGSESSRP